MIFSEFGRSERSVQLGYKGLGLGLAICKRLVEMQDGTIGVKSNGKVGDGSTFYFTLPTTQPAADQVEPVEQTHTEESVDSNQPVFTVLVVDNEPNTLELHTRIVQSHSLSNRVLQACDGQQALEIMERESVDLVLLDLQMPVMDGFAVLDRMRADERLQKVPVIVVTGHVLTAAEMTQLHRGVAAVLEKGLFGLDETVARIGAALERKRRLSSEAQRLIRTAMAFIHENYAQPLSRKDIAKHISIADDYLTFCFRQELGTTPIKYLQRYRINRAKTLLKEGTLSITEIAGRVGFSDSSYFSRIFHRETGISPEEFRRRGA
jgi:AraC-like DNA-binding protein